MSSSVNETVFVTGGCGFVGYHLIKELKRQGKQVRCLVRPSSNRERLARMEVEFVEGDLMDLESLKRGIVGVDSVIHLAGLTREIRKNEFLRVNRDGCRNIAAACDFAQEKNGRMMTLVSVSSLAAAGPARTFQSVSHERSYAPKKETEIPTPLSPYGESKLAGEKELLAFAERFPISIVRPPFIFGQYDSLALPLFRMIARSSLFLIPGYFNQLFSFIHASDLANILLRILKEGDRLSQESLSSVLASESAILSSEPRTSRFQKALSSCSGQGIYYAAHPQRILFSEFGQLIHRSLGTKKLHVLKCPPLGVLGTGFVLEQVKHWTGHPVSLDWNKAVESIHGPWICSEEKVTKTLDYSFEQSLESQIAQTVDWYRQNDWL